ncbi:MAG: helix-turn-helix transcriptional regulator [Trueperaceae bacterium]|nr:helix-turn-helix transcriptional regulator [Trueperaceae bacterium]
MSTKKRPVPEVDQVTPELKALLAQFADDEIATGVIARGGIAATAAESHTAAALQDCLADAILEQSLAQLLRSARTTAELSLADMAERLGVTRGRVHQLEQEGANLELRTLQRCASALGYDMRVMFVPREADKPVLSVPIAREKPH